MRRVLFAAALLLVAIHATPLDDYVSKPEDVYKWADTGVVVEDLYFGGKAYILNVTSLSWLDSSRAYSARMPIERNTIWSHQVMVVVPKELKVTNASTMVLNGGCIGGKYPDKKDEYLELASRIAQVTGQIGVVVNQIPNCPYVFPADPEKKHRQEDALLAWAWKSYVDDPKHDPTWLPRLPMVKSAFQCMRAVEDFTRQKSIASIEGWTVAGASKRGWTTWLVGAATCPTCPKILGIAPLVPIVPNLRAEIHRQWMSYGGFTFAFDDYTAVNFTQYIDTPVWQSALDVIDPMYYGHSLARLPKMVVLSSDDEFMQFDWSNIWYNNLTGEKHLLVAPNAEHSLATGLIEVVGTIGAWINSISHGQPATARPSFTHTVDAATGKISVQLAPGFKAIKVVLRHTETWQSSRRDFRWVRAANNYTEACTLPEIKLKKTMFGGGNCIVPIFWHSTKLKESSVNAGLYEGQAPTPKHEGRWTGYYIEMYFESGTGIRSEYRMTTPGYAFPDTLPFKDCHGTECVGRLL